MDSLVQQIFLVTGVVFFLGIIVYLLRKNALSLKYSLLWLFSATAMLIIGIFPAVLVFISDLLGFTLPSNALFAILLGFVILNLLSLTSIVSKQTEHIKTLVQTNALLEQRIRELEESGGHERDRNA
ncbi:MAG: DUF2304 domain-containing protein [Lachnospiraceae bacterium]|jgi:hypothetical protein|nr:DUF2304 domain-containing protein [Lachnospiraceae bacterium]